MKRYSNFAYTATAKRILVVLIILSGWLASDAFNRLFTYSVENSEGIRNVFRQGFNFDYESSVYADSQIKNAINSFFEYSLKYMTDENISNAGSRKKLDAELKKSDKRYASVAEHIESLDGVYFAIANHTTGKITSNLPDIDGADAKTEIRQLFTDKGKYLITVYNSKNPYFEQGFSERFIESIREMAKEYPDNFDLYINFGDSLYIVTENQDFEKLYRDTIINMDKDLIFFIGAFIVLTLLSLRLISITGKAEKSAKIHQTTTDSLPNDVLIILYLTLIISVCLMYHTSIYMLYKIYTVDNFGAEFGLPPPDYYKVKMNVCVCTSSVTFLMLITKIKRQRYFGTLFTNTLISSAIEFIRNKLSKNA